MSDLAAAKAIVARTATYLYLEEDEPDRLYYSTRDHGSVGDETPGQADIIEARRVRSAVKAALGDSITARIEVIDEWVGLTIS